LGYTVYELKGFEVRTVPKEISPDEQVLVAIITSNKRRSTETTVLAKGIGLLHSETWELDKGKKYLWFSKELLAVIEEGGPHQP